jgi:hypothetical protein
LLMIETGHSVCKVENDHGEFVFRAVGCQASRGVPGEVRGAGPRAPGEVRGAGTRGPPGGDKVRGMGRGARDGGWGGRVRGMGRCVRGVRVSVTSF